MSETLNQKFESLNQILKNLDKVVIAYSGGVDSTFLLKASVETLGSDNVLACIAKGPSLPQSQYVKAIEAAKNMGVKIETVEPDELSDASYSSNKADRCFHCKSHLLNTLVDVAKEKGFEHILCGNNFDDIKDYRPGSRAVEVFGVKCPLQDAQLTKNDIRQLSRNFNLPTADVPASPCLASRVSYGLEITQQRLNQIEQAEEFLRTLGLVEFRVRHHDQVARIEVKPQDIEKIISEPARSQIVEKLKSLGFKFVALDLQGFRSGAMNEQLSNEQKKKSMAQ
jgi:pyridinium-3,5-biscarboxylic acid mononucleotide sulfurtransferase